MFAFGIIASHSRQRTDPPWHPCPFDRSLGRYFVTVPNQQTFGWGCGVYALCPSVRPEGLGASAAVPISGHQVPAGTGTTVVCRQDRWGQGGRPEPLHLTLSAPGWPARILGPVVEVPGIARPRSSPAWPGREVFAKLQGPQRRMLPCATVMPRSARIGTTSRTPGLNSWQSHTAWLMISAGARHEPPSRRARLQFGSIGTAASARPRGAARGPCGIGGGPRLDQRPSRIAGSRAKATPSPARNAARMGT